MKNQKEKSWYEHHYLNFQGMLLISSLSWKRRYSSATHSLLSPGKETLIHSWGYFYLPKPIFFSSTSWYFVFLSLKSWKRNCVAFDQEMPVSAYLGGTHFSSRVTFQRHTVDIFVSCFVRDNFQFIVQSLFNLVVSENKLSVHYQMRSFFSCWLWGY